MKYTLFLMLIPCLNLLGQSNKIDSSNYYNFYQKQGYKTIWLKEKDVLETMDEVINNCHIEAFFRNSILRLTEGEHLRLTMFSPKYNLGILYIQGHSMFPIKSERGMSIYDVNTDYKYLQWIELIDGTRTGYKIFKIPDNVIVLTENSYWYQEPITTSNIPFVTKEIILEIFKNDFRKSLSSKIKN